MRAAFLCYTVNIIKPAKGNLTTDMASNDLFLKLILAILPTVLIIVFILAHDKNKKEPPLLLIILFVLGCLTVIPALYLEIFFEGFLPDIYTAPLIVAFIGVALPEEFVKYVTAMVVAFNRRSYDEVYDGIIYCVFVSLGFATVENVMYVLSFDISTALMRAVTSVPAHAMFGVSMGYNMSMAKVRFAKTRYHILAFVSPIVLHGIYDYILFSGMEMFLFIFFPFLIWMYIKSIRLVRSTHDLDPFA